jgi:hypothetical protein
MFQLLTPYEGYIVVCGAAIGAYYIVRWILRHNDQARAEKVAQGRLRALARL